MPSSAERSDADLVAASRAGDAGAFDALVRRHYRAAYAVALAVSGTPMDAEDICQDAFLKALERLEECRDPARFRGWLLRIVRNHAHNVRASQARRAGVPLDAGTALPSGPAGRPAELDDLREHLLRGLAGLTETQRAVVLLHDLEGLTHREIAAAIDTSEGMSRQHLFQARRILREHFAAGPVREYLP